MATQAYMLSTWEDEAGASQGQDIRSCLKTAIKYILVYFKNSTKRHQTATDKPLKVFALAKSQHKKKKMMKIGNTGRVSKPVTVLHQWCSFG